MHNLETLLDRLRVGELDDAAAPGLVIFVDEELYEGHFAHVTAEEVLQVLPAVLIGDVRNVDAAVGGLHSGAVFPPVRAAVSLPAALGEASGAVAARSVSGAFFVVVSHGFVDLDGWELFEDEVETVTDLPFWLCSMTAKALFAIEKETKTENTLH